MTTLHTKDSNKYTVTGMCDVLDISRHAYTNFVDHAQNEQSGFIDKDAQLIDKIKGIVTTTRKYGYRRVTRELRRQGVHTNHKKVLRLMQTHNLTCKRKKMFKTTTDSNHNHQVYPNLLKDFVPTGINQVWGSDITYIRLSNNKFVYLAVVIDLYSRKVVGWAMSKYIDENLTLAALDMALSTRTPALGLIHHSDRGVQYASLKYTTKLRDNNIQISMSAKGNPYDNAFVESFMNTLKNEEVHMNEYDSLEDAQQNINLFLEEVYNKKRLHSSLDYVSPDEFEFALSSVSTVSSLSVPR